MSLALLITEHCIIQVRKKFPLNHCLAWIKDSPVIRKLLIDSMVSSFYPVSSLTFTLSEKRSQLSITIGV